MNEQEFKQRTKALGLRVIKLVSSLPKNTVSEVIGKQLIRSGTSEQLVALGQQQT